MNDNELTEVIARLDKEVAREDATIIFMQYSAGPIEHRVIANRAGYLRFGIEFLKAAIAPPSDETNKNPFAIEVDLEYLVEDSDIDFGCFERRETFESIDSKEGNRETLTFRDKASNFGCSLFFYSAIALAFIGLITVIKWIF